VNSLTLGEWPAALNPVVRAITYYRPAGGRIVDDDTMTTPDLTQLLGHTTPAPAGP
jgi:hypothetical protein